MAFNKNHYSILHLQIHVKENMKHKGDTFIFLEFMQRIQEEVLIHNATVEDASFKIDFDSHYLNFKHPITGKTLLDEAKFTEYA